MPFSKKFATTMLSLTISAATAAALAQGPTPNAAGSTPPSAMGGDACANVPNSDHPKATITNGAVEAVLFLPDKDNGYYRAARFDWAGVIGCVAYKGHTYFGQWFPRYDPLVNDSITGPVEEFRAPTSELGYDDAANNGRFLKIGVGVLHKSDDTPYKFGGAYTIVDTGERSTKISGRSVTFTQIIHTDFGYAYKYEKTVELDKHGAVLTLHHKLKNLGTKPLETDVYDHDFFMLDNKPIGAGMVVKLGFALVPDKPFPDVVTVTGNEISFNHAPTRGNTAQGYLTGYTGKPGEYFMSLEDTTTHVGVEQTSSSPLSKFYFWSTAKTICPEGYIHVSVAPGKTQEWDIHYRFKAE
jgi:hypothetical protein